MENASSQDCAVADDVKVQPQVDVSVPHLEEQPPTVTEEDMPAEDTVVTCENMTICRQRQRRQNLPAALILIGAGWVATMLFRAFRQQQQQLTEACRQLRSVQERLAAREQDLEKKDEERKREHDSRASELSQQVADAQRELEAARDMCRLAASKLEQSMSDLSVTDTELRAARTQLHTASRDLALTRAQLEATEGELGLTRSQNELMKREVDILRRQLKEAGQQLEGYIMVSRSRKDGLAGGRSGLGREELEDDLAPGLGDWDL